MAGPRIISFLRNSLAAFILCCLLTTRECRTFIHEQNRDRNTRVTFSVNSSSVYNDNHLQASDSFARQSGILLEVGYKNSIQTTSNNTYQYQSSNIIDDCWRGDSNWAINRTKLADCAVGFGSNAVGGRDGTIYVVTDQSDHAVYPAPGTLRYGVIQLFPLWIIFRRDMTIKLENELIMTGDKTIDGRGANVHIAGGPCITIQDVSNIIIHGLYIHDCKAGKPGMVASSTAHVGYRNGSDGDGISMFGSQSVWIDHNFLSNCNDGLIDAIRGSTAITISNNVFTNHNKVMLLGHDDAFTVDKGMRVTITYNRFGPGCVQRMPRCRLGLFHVINNDYAGWEMYAVGGSGDPTIISEGNRYLALNNRQLKQVTKRDCSSDPSTWAFWTWKSDQDIFLNGAYFVQSGEGNVSSLNGSSSPSSSVSATSFLPSMTAHAGPLVCSPGEAC